jgi:hypothetical protein
MVTKGGGITRTKHMLTRMHLVLEAVNEHRVAIHYINTSGMLADGLTKPIDGKYFDYFVNKILSHDKMSAGGH